jgi:predicted Fe-Mo cluster-binding NifX family protein
MKLAVPSSDGSGMASKVFPHFGRCPFYTVVDSESGVVSILQNTSLHFGGSKEPPQLLHDAGIETLICYDLGRRAVSMFQELGIEVHIGAEGTVEEAIDAFKRGYLGKPEADYNCEGHKENV